MLYLLGRYSRKRQASTAVNGTIEQWYNFLLQLLAAEWYLDAIVDFTLSDTLVEPVLNGNNCEQV
jgi:hypothetical protein